MENINGKQEKQEKQEKKIRLYGFDALEKKIIECEKKERLIRSEKAEVIELLAKRFFNFLRDSFYEYRENGIDIIFKNADQELKLMDVMYEKTYWLIFDDKVSGKKMEYLVHALSSSYTLLQVYEKIMEDVIPLYEKNKKMYERKNKLTNDLKRLDEKNNSGEFEYVREKI